MSASLFYRCSTVSSVCTDVDTVAAASRNGEIGSYKTSGLPLDYASGSFLVDYSSRRFAR